MNPLSELQLDALVEIFNIGVGRAAASLSDIVGEAVRLSVPKIAFYQSSEISPDSFMMNNQRLGAVQQNFSGQFAANAMLLFTEDRALEIVRDMMGSELSVEDLAEYEQEAMCELGNIILNACLSSIADILNLTLESSLPEYSVTTAELLVEKIATESSQPIMLVLHIDLVIENRISRGSMVFLLSSTSLKSLMNELDRFVSGI